MSLIQPKVKLNIVQAGWSVFALLFFAYAYIHQGLFDGPTAVSRLDVLHAIWQTGSVSIDAYHTNTPDKSVYAGHYYCDKAPGTVAVALPVFITANSGLKLAGVDTESHKGWLISSWITTVFSLGLFTALGGMACFRWLANHVSPTAAFITTVGLFLGAAPLPYATMMFSHALVVALLFIAISISNAGEKRLQSMNLVESWNVPVFSGFACGLAMASEFSAGLAVLGAMLICVKQRYQNLVWFSAGFMPPLLLIPLYSWLCFGEPLTLAYSFHSTFPEMREGVYAIKWPDEATACKLLFSPTRGLFFWTPLLILAFYGYIRLFQLSSKLFWIVYLIPVVHIIIISGRTWDWQAGPTLGPRLLAPILPLLALPCALGVEKLLPLGMILATLSIGLTTIGTLTDACPPGRIYNPLLEFHLPKLCDGTLSYNLGMLAGLRPHLSVMAYYIIIFLCCAIILWSIKNHSQPMPLSKIAEPNP